MSKLTSQQKEFLKGIPNKKARQEQKIQFKLQNSYNGNVVFINGKFETDLEKLAHFINGHPMMDIMFKEDLIPKENNHKFIDYGEFKNTIPDFKHNFNQKPLEFDLPKKEDKVCLFIDEIINHASFPKKYIDKKILKAYLDLIYLNKKMNLNQF